MRRRLLILMMINSFSGLIGNSFFDDKRKIVRSWLCLAMKHWISRKNFGLKTIDFFDNVSIVRLPTVQNYRWRQLIELLVSKYFLLNFDWISFKGALNKTEFINAFESILDLNEYTQLLEKLFDKVLLFSLSKEKNSIERFWHLVESERHGNDQLEWFLYAYASILSGRRLRKYTTNITIQ